MNDPTQGIRERLRQLRGTTPSPEWGDRYGATHQTVRSYEDGTTRSIPVDYVARVCEGEGVRCEWMLWGTGPMRQTPDPSAARTLNAIRAMLEELEG